MAALTLIFLLRTYFAFCILLLTTPLFGQELRRVDFTGVTDEDILYTAIFQQRQPPIKLTSNSELTLELQRIQRESLAWLQAKGYYAAAIDSVVSFKLDSFVNEVTVHVQQGSRYLLREIRIVGDPAPRNFEFDTPVDAPLNTLTLEEDVTRLLQAIEKQGYPLARVAIERIEPILSSDTELVAILRVERKGAARIGRITIEGNTSTRDYVITRELGFREGELLIPSQLEQGRAALERLGYFESVEMPRIYLLDDSTVEVRVRVAEARTTTIDAILGYNPPTAPNGSGYISGLVDLGFRNISGTARDAALHYSRLSESTQRLSAQYREPWLFGYPLHVSLKFDQYQQDSSYVSTQMQGGLTYSATQSLSLNASLLYDRVIPTDLPESPFIAFNSRKLLTLLSAMYDTRDELLAPRYGVLLRIGGNYGSKRLNGPERFLPDSVERASTLSELALDISAFTPTFTRNLVLAIALHAKRTAVFGSTLDQSDLTRLGGARTLRGYREDELLASRYAYFNLEYRLLTARQSYLFTFVDAGWLERAPIVNDPNTIRSNPFSYGIGIQQLTPVGVLSLSIGLSKDESFDRAKVHFGLLTRI